MKVREQFRQGDVFIERVRSVPKGAKLVAREAGRVVLAHGEATGHTHAIEDLEALLYDHEGEFYLQADGTVTLRHEEHAPITIEPGVYKVTRQREYSPEEIRNVAD